MTQPKVEYFTVEGAPGRYFRCDKYNAVLSTSACASMYLAEKNQHLGRHMHCRGCPVGAMHAGEAPVTAPELVRSMVCPRCLRSSSRLVRGVCMSCINRQYESVKGVNARGKPPTRYTPLAALSVPARDDKADFVASVEFGSGYVEMVLRVFRAKPTGRAVGRLRSVRPMAMQESLFMPRVVSV